MPEETKDYIHIPISDAGIFVDDSFKTITISASQGIKSVIGKLKSDPEGSTKVQKYLFSKEKGWTMTKAKAWVKEHSKSYERELDDKLYKFRLPCVIEKATKDNLPDEIDPEVASKYLGVFKAVVSTSALDSDRDIITWKAIEKGAKQLNERGIILFNHNNYDPPIGRFISAWAINKGENSYGVESGEIHGWVGISKTAEMIWTLIDEGILKEMSVGGYLNDADEFYDDDDNFDYRLITDWDLLEASVVNIAANPEAQISVVLGKMLKDRTLGGDDNVSKDEDNTLEDPPVTGGDDETPDPTIDIKEVLDEHLTAFREELLGEIDSKIEEAQNQSKEDIEGVKDSVEESIDNLNQATETTASLVEVLFAQQGIEIEDDGDSPNEGDENDNED